HHDAFDGEGHRHGAHVVPGEEILRGKAHRDEEHEDDDDQPGLAHLEKVQERIAHPWSAKGCILRSDDHRFFTHYDACLCSSPIEARYMILSSVISGPVTSPVIRPSRTTSTLSQTPISSGSSDEMTMTPTPLLARSRTMR